MADKLLNIDEAFTTLDLNSKTYLPWRVRWDESSAAYDSDRLVIFDEAATRERCKWLGYDDDYAAQIISHREEMLQNKAMMQLLWHIFYCMSHPTNPMPANYDTSVNLPESLGHQGEMFYIYLYLCLVEHPIAMAEARDVPEQITRDTLYDIVRWTKFNSEDKKRLALTQGVWLNHHIGGRIHTIGRLQHERRACDYAAILARDPETGKLNAYREDEYDQVRGEIYLQKDDPIISIHIPRSGAMDHEACTQSFVDAKHFLKMHYPEFQPKAYCCFSWLTNPLWSEYLSATSNVRKFVERYHYYPLPDREDTGLWYWLYQTWKPHENLDDAPQESSVQKAFIKHLKSGKKWMVSGGYILPEEIPDK
ncbi:hypothetical protein KS4_12400 [Poriferisphaera corsica]|uniref:Uncharacterized protein n=1 Tax=Poriferisphaera corsica TaxID=2528020 RepID=A0A517YSI7_9BACT|nr:acyltransferase domain-containing protein [Poriferisphaera corsica]QDU33195.1 hypothetical protein KS4_12400 [Poriferisphaera corsica]